MNKRMIECLNSKNISNLTTSEVKQFFKGKIVEALPKGKRFYVSRNIGNTYIYNREGDFLGILDIKNYNIYNEDREYIGTIQEK